MKKRIEAEQIEMKKKHFKISGPKLVDVNESREAPGQAPLRSHHTNERVATKEKDNNFQTKEKIVYTNQGWGMNPVNKKKNFSEILKTSTESIKLTNNSGNKIKTKAIRIIEHGNQKIITKKKKKIRQLPDNFWIGGDENASSSEGEWVEEKHY